MGTALTFIVVLVVVLLLASATGLVPHENRPTPTPPETDLFDAVPNGTASR